MIEPTAAFLADFGVSVTLAGAAVRAFFDAAYIDAMRVSGSSPAILLPTTSAGAATYGTAAVIDAVSYAVAERHDSPPDHPGWTLLILEAA